jgi:hypothetical protein
MIVAKNSPAVEAVLQAGRSGGQALSRCKANGLKSV